MSAVQLVLVRLQDRSAWRPPCNLCVLFQDHRQAAIFVEEAVRIQAERFRVHLTVPHEQPTKAGGPHACERLQLRGRQTLADLLETGQAAVPAHETAATLLALIVTDSGIRDALLPQTEWGTEYYAVLECLVSQIAHSTWHCPEGADEILRRSVRRAVDIWMNDLRDTAAGVLAVRDAARKDKHPSHVAMTGSTEALHVEAPAV
jgi:hypothetical protein